VFLDVDFSDWNPVWNQQWTNAAINGGSSMVSTSDRQVSMCYQQRRHVVEHSRLHSLKSTYFSTPWNLLKLRLKLCKVDKLLYLWWEYAKYFQMGSENGGTSAGSFSLWVSFSTWGATSPDPRLGAVLQHPTEGRPSLDPIWKYSLYMYNN